VSRKKQVTNPPRKARRQRVDEREWAKRNRAFNKKVLDKIVGDLQFREALLTDPQSALRSAGLAKELRELDQHDAVLMIMRPPPRSLSRDFTLGSGQHS
jgi:hypothetical protein